MKNLTTSTLLLTVGIVTSIGLMPNIASAESSVRIDLPGISIGLNDRHSSDRYRNNNHQRYYLPTYRSSTNKTYRNSNQYYYQSNQRTYSPSYQSEICPEPGYSPNYYDGHGCTQHYDHYHCD